MNNFEAKKRARIENYLKKAEEHQKAGNEMHKVIQTLCGMMGEPVKIGHHSERRHRRLIEKSDRALKKAVDHWQKAEIYRQKAEAVEKNTKIYSDDPEAVNKLEDKLKSMIETHEKMKEINKEYRKCKDIEKMKVEDSIKEALKKAKAEHDKKYEWEFKPFQPFQIRNSYANIKRVKLRIEKLKKQASATTKEEQGDGVTIVDNVEINRVQLIFDSIPPEEIRKRLKQRGFRWSRKNGAWQRQRSENAMFWARKIAESVKQQEE